MELFLAGDVMTGRGIDQILPNPGDPTLYESWVKSASEYVRIAEQANGPIPRRVEPSYIWGDTLDVLEERHVSTRIINLETAVTDRGEPWPQKGIHYRMHPANVDCITAARIDCCVLANNHVLDWSHDGLEQTLTALGGSGVSVAGAGKDIDEAWTPAPIDGGNGRILVLGVGMTSSGIPRAWEAGPATSGLALTADVPDRVVEQIAGALESERSEGDVVVVSIHWGSNWGYDIPARHREIAHWLIDQAGADVIHGHSSHHPLGIEVHSGRPILYGCGDLINDYEGIGGHEEFRSELRALYLLTLDADGLQTLELVPMRAERFSLHRANAEETAWMARKLTDMSAAFGAAFEVDSDGALSLRW